MLVGDIFFPDVGDGRLQEIAGDLEVPQLPDSVEAVAWGLRAQPAFTELELTPEVWQQMIESASDYRIEPLDRP